MGLIIITLQDVDEVSADIHVLAEPGFEEAGNGKVEEFRERKGNSPSQMIAKEMMAAVAESGMYTQIRDVKH